ncbi:MAG TPA: efflux RND transporter periplasmic adaptor subunit [Gemmataceae bacterium]|jgi:membrane fusion protein (multidrug efflux system)
MKVSRILTIIPALISLSLSACYEHKEEAHQEEQNKIVVTSPIAKDVVVTQKYVCQIHSQRHINVRALVDGYLEKIVVKEGQRVNKGDSMFQIFPVLYEAKYEAAKAEAKHAELEYNYTKSLSEKKAVSENEVALYLAKWKSKKAEEQKALAEFKFTDIKAPFDGIVDMLRDREGSLIKERDILTTLSDNSVMWVYFNVPEANYLEYMAHVSEENKIPLIELKLANQKKFQYLATNLTIEAQFNNQTGTIPFRADFENPHGLLRHGQTGDVLIHQTLKNVVVIPQRAVFEILDKRYVYVLGEDDVAHQRLITIEPATLEDIFVIKSGLEVKDKIVLEGVRQVKDGGKVEEFEFRKPEDALAHQKSHAE